MIISWDNRKYIKKENEMKTSSHNEIWEYFGIDFVLGKTK